MLARKYPNPKHKASLDPLWDETSEASSTSISKDTQLLLFLEKYWYALEPWLSHEQPLHTLGFLFLFFWAPLLLLTPILKPVEKSAELQLCFILVHPEILCWGKTKPSAFAGWRSWKSPAGHCRRQREQCFCCCQCWHRCGFVYHLYEALLVCFFSGWWCTVMPFACMSLFSPRVM